MRCLIVSLVAASGLIAVVWPVHAAGGEAHTNLRTLNINLGDLPLWSEDGHMLPDYIEQILDTVLRRIAAER